MSAVGTLDPTTERLLEEARTRERNPLVGRERSTRWLLLVAFALTAVGVVVAAPPGRATNLPLTIAMVVAYAMASRVEFEVGSGLTMPTQLVLVPMLFVLPLQLVPLLVALGLVVGAMPDLMRGRTSVGRLALVGGNAFYAVAPVLVIMFFGEPDAWQLRGCLALAVAVLAQGLFDATLSFTSEWFALRIPPRSLTGPLTWTLTIDVLLTPIGLMAAIAASRSTLAVFLPVSLLGILLIFARERRERLGGMLELSNAYRGTALLLGDVVEVDDEYTGAHSKQVVELVLAVADRMHMDAGDKRRAEFAALLHDVGKLKIPASIINKPGALTPEERAIINTHTIEGQKLLTPIGGLLAEVGEIVRSCHEHVDGNGYPDKLVGADIPLAARIISCCDAYNAMTTDRPYRKALTQVEAIAELQRHRGSQFDTDVVDTLILEVTADRVRKPGPGQQRRWEAANEREGSGSYLDAAESEAWQDTLLAAADRALIKLEDEHCAAAQRRELIPDLLALRQVLIDQRQSTSKIATSKIAS